MWTACLYRPHGGAFVTDSLTVRTSGRPAFLKWEQHQRIFHTGCCNSVWWQWLERKAAGIFFLRKCKNPLRPHREILWLYAHQVMSECCSSTVTPLNILNGTNNALIILKTIKSHPQNFLSVPSGSSIFPYTSFSLIHSWLIALKPSRRTDGAFIWIRGKAKQWMQATCCATPMM